MRVDFDDIWQKYSKYSGIDLGYITSGDAI